MSSQNAWIAKVKVFESMAVVNMVHYPIQDVYLSRSKVVININGLYHMVIGSQGASV